MHQRTSKNPKNEIASTTATLPTFMDHVRELQGRLFSVAIVFVVMSGAAYPFFDKIVNLLLAPLGKDHELVYLTPGGAFSFIIQVCMYIGFIASLPVIIYNIYRFIMPVMNKVTARMALVYTVSSLVLALGGIVFAYVVSLPAALYFLTSFNLYHINPMLTIDSYFSFIMTYMLAGALLFQIPLIMLLINGATPLKPKKLMHHQGNIILVSFIVAAIVSPTPDALNQTLLASPMVVMYQVGIILVWLKNRKRQRREAAVVERALARPIVMPVAAIERRPLTPPKLIQAIDVNTTTKSLPTVSAPKAVRTVDGFVVRTRAQARPLPQLTRPVPVIERQLQTPKPAGHVTGRSLDGFIVRPQARVM